MTTPTPCAHDASDKDTAIYADGLCPYCLQRDLAAAQEELASVKAHAEAMYRSVYYGRNSDEEFAADAYRAAFPKDTP